MERSNLADLAQFKKLGDLTTAEIFVRIQEPAFHHWPSAPEESAYLASRHRHLFHIEARCAVDHDDREIEFHDLQHQVRTVWMLEIAPVQEAGGQSCEGMARRLAENLALIFNRAFIVIVSEDNECGAEVRVASHD